MDEPRPTADLAAQPLTAEEEAGIRSGWWQREARRGALAVGYVPRLLATLDALRAASRPAVGEEGLREAVGEWFAGHCPADWTEDDHLRYPHVNLPPEEHALADAYVAALAADKPDKP